MTLPTLTGSVAGLPFFDQSLNSSACNVATTRKALHYAKGIEISEKRCREIMGKLSGPTGTAHTERVFRHFGLVKGTDYVLLLASPWARARDLLRDGWFVTFFVRYRYVNNNFPRHSGDLNFNGAHAVGSLGRWRAGSYWRSAEHDPLHNGRRNAKAPGGRYPQGPVRCRLPMLRVATEKYTQDWLRSTEKGAGRATGYAVMRSDFGGRQ